MANYCLSTVWKPHWMEIHSRYELFDFLVLNIESETSLDTFFALSQSSIVFSKKLSVCLENRIKMRKEIN